MNPSLNLSGGQGVCVGGGGGTTLEGTPHERGDSLDPMSRKPARIAWRQNARSVRPWRTTGDDGIIDAGMTPSGSEADPRPVSADDAELSK